MLAGISPGTGGLSPNGTAPAAHKRRVPLHQPSDEPVRDTKPLGCSANVEQPAGGGYGRRKSLSDHDDQPGAHGVSRGELSKRRSLAATCSRSWYIFGTWRREEGTPDESGIPSELVLPWWRGQDLNLRPSGYEPFQGSVGQ